MLPDDSFFTSTFERYNIQYPFTGAYGLGVAYPRENYPGSLPQHEEPAQLTVEQEVYISTGEFDEDRINFILITV